MKSDSDGLLKYLNECHTPYHSAEYLAGMLEKAGALRLREQDAWDIEYDRTYCFIKNGTMLCFFRISSSKEPVKCGFHIAGAHHDAPGLRIKPAVSTTDDGYERLTVEPYGGLIHHVWMDRPLSCAGRVFYAEDGEVKHADFDMRKPFAVIPSAAIHMVPGVNDGAKFDMQTEIRPFAAQSENGEKHFTERVIRAAGIEGKQLLSFDMQLYDAAKADYAGLDEEFISASRLDDCEMAYAAVAGAVSGDAAPESFIAFIYDHEECGSASDRGAQSGVLESVIERICSKIGYSKEDMYRALSLSVIFSADMAHAAHPSYKNTGDPNTVVKLNKGPVLKINSNQSYATSGEGCAFFKKLCIENDIPYQEYVNRSTVKGGRTIGPMLSAKCGAVAADIGNPILAMHSVRELGGAYDVHHMRRLFSAFL